MFPGSLGPRRNIVGFTPSVLQTASNGVPRPKGEGEEEAIFQRYTDLGLNYIRDRERERGGGRGGGQFYTQ